MSRNPLTPLLMSALVILSGCGTMAPKYTQPKAPVPSEWPNGAAFPKSKESANAPSAQNLKWRDFITDEQVAKIIEMALDNNRDLRLAALNVERARAQYGLQRDQLLPTVAAVGNESKQDYTGIAGYTVTQQGKPVAPIVKRVLSKEDTVSIGISSWEIDFFGRIRSLKEAAQQQYFATEQARRAAQIMLISEVAGEYYTLAADRENLKLAETTLETQQASYNLVKRRFECGVATELDLRRAETQVESARGDASRYTQIVAQDLNALNYLIGKSAPEDLLASALGTITPPKEISEGATSEALLSRPDVIQAEDLLKAANANIGAARAAFFPRISLTAAAGTASNELSGLFDAKTGIWSFAPQIALPVLNTQIWHSARISKVEKELAIAQYEKAIQNAFKEVSDALAARGTIDNQVASQEALVKAVAETYRLSNLRYEKGADSYLSVLDAQRTHYAAQQGLVSLRLAKIANQVKLYAVLGGGFDKPDSEKHEQQNTETPKAK